MVDGGIVLHARVGACPGGRPNLTHEIAGFVRFVDFTGRAQPGVPIAVVFAGLHKSVGDAHRVVGVLAGNGLVGFAVEVGTVAGGHQRGNLLFFSYFPIDEIEYFRVIHVQADHFGGSPRRPAGLDGACALVQDFQKGHQAR